MAQSDTRDRREGERRRLFSQEPCTLNSPYGKFEVEQNECHLIIRNGAQGAVAGRVRDKVLVRFFDLPVALISIPQHWITLN